MPEAMTQQRISDDEIAALLEKRDGDDANDMWAAKGAIEKSSDKLIRDLQDARALLAQKDAEIAALKARVPNPGYLNPHQCPKCGELVPCP